MKVNQAVSQIQRLLDPSVAQSRQKPMPLVEVFLGWSFPAARLSALTDGRWLSKTTIV